MLVRIDDLILTRSNPTFINDLISSLSKEFLVKGLDYNHYFLGVQVTWIPIGLILNKRNEMQLTFFIAQKFT